MDLHARYLQPSKHTAKVLKVQILQSLSIFFQNLSNNALVFYLLSNDHINELITHRFDFHDEELMAYYISFLKVETPTPTPTRVSEPPPPPRSMGFSSLSLNASSSPRPSLNGRDARARGRAGAVAAAGP